MGVTYKTKERVIIRNAPVEVELPKAKPEIKFKKKTKKSK